MKRFALASLIYGMLCFTANAFNGGDRIVFWLIICLVDAVCVGIMFALDSK